jgi:hypothetical protein
MLQDHLPRQKNFQEKDYVSRHHDDDLLRLRLLLQLQQLRQQLRLRRENDLVCVLVFFHVRLSLLDISVLFLFLIIDLVGRKMEYNTEREETTKIVR